MQPIRIDDPADPRVAPYRDLRDRDLLREGLFIAEGKVVLDVLFEARRFFAQSVLVLEGRLPGLAATLAKAPADTPVYVASAPVIDAIAGYHLHRGVLAAVRRRPAGVVAEILDALPGDAVVPVLCGIANHDNVGSIFRNAAAFGAPAVLLDAGSCDPLYRKAIRVSVGAALKVPFAVVDAASLPGLLAQRGFRALALSPAGTGTIDAVAGGGRIALFLGTEGDGLPADLMAQMETVRIPMAPGFDSLNVAAASAIALHRLAAVA